MPATLARSAGGDALLLARGASLPKPAVLLERYDTRGGSRLAARTIELTPVPPQGASYGPPPQASLVPTPPTLHPLDPDRTLLSRGSYYDWSRTLTEWRLVGPDLADLATRRGTSSSASESGDPRTLAWSQWCRPNPRGSQGETLVLLCEDSAFKRMLHLVDARTLDDLTFIGLPNRFQRGAVMAWDVRDGGAVTILTEQTVVTEQPALIRVENGVMTDRSVEPAAAFPFARFPVRLYGQTQGTALFSPDGRIIYVTQSDDVHRRRSLAAIDVASTRVVATQFAGLDVRALRLSPDGRRLYALVADAGPATISRPDDAQVRLALLDPRTLRVLARTDPLAPTAQQIVAVATR